MAHKRKQPEEKSQEPQETKRMRNNESTTQRAQHNQLMARAAIARINKTKQNQQSIQFQPPMEQNQLQSNQPTSEQESPEDILKDYKLEIENLNKAISTYTSVIKTQTDLIDSIKSSLSCNICFEIIDSPYALLCGHIFCHKDLYAWFHRSSSSLSDQRDHHHHHHPTTARLSSRNLDYRSSDSERIEAALNRSTTSAAGPRATTNANRSARVESETELNPISQEGQQTAPLDERTHNTNSNRYNLRPATLRPMSPRRRRQNLICPQCRAAVTGRPISLYAIKEITTKLKAGEPPTSTSSTSGPTPVPSSSDSHSFRNLVESHRDEKDLTWGDLFNPTTSNPTGAVQDFAQHVIIDSHDSVRRCGRCAWEIGPDGLCAGCGAEYLDFIEDSSTSSDSDFSESSEYMGTDFSEGAGEGEDSSGESADLRQFPWGGGNDRHVGRVGLAWVQDEGNSDEDEELSPTEMHERDDRSQTSLSQSSEEIRTTGVAGNARRNIIRVSSDSEDEDYRFGPPSDRHQSSTSNSSSSSIDSGRAESIHSSRPEYMTSGDHGLTRSEQEDWGRTTSDDEDSRNPSRPERDRLARSFSESDDHSTHGGSDTIREVHYNSSSDCSLGLAQSSDHFTSWSRDHHGDSDDNATENQSDHESKDQQDEDQSDHQFDESGFHENHHWDTEDSSWEDDDDL